jgi:uncharacterized membrane protein YebE (DUF533 family)
MTDHISGQEALIYVMVSVAAADRTINTDEIQRISSIVRELPAFRSYTDDWFSSAAQKCVRQLSKPQGVEKVLSLVRSVLNPRLYETAYVLAAEVAASDMAEHPAEEQYLDLLAETLGLDDLTTVALERAAEARHRPI